MRRVSKPPGLVSGTAVYRFYEAPGVLLYVGISSVPEVRFRQHALNAKWWPLVDHSLTEVVWRPCRGLAEAEEVCAIIVERPIYNIKDKPGRVYRVPPPAPTEVMGARAIPMNQVYANLTRVVTEAMNGTPTVLLKHGKPRAVLVSEEQARIILRHLGKEDVLETAFTCSI